MKVQLLLNEDMHWAKKCYVQMEEQLPLKAAIKSRTISEAAAGSGQLNISTTAGKTFVEAYKALKIFDNTRPVQ